MSGEYRISWSVVSMSFGCFAVDAKVGGVLNWSGVETLTRKLFPRTGKSVKIGTLFWSAVVLGVVILMIAIIFMRIFMMF